MRRTEPSPGHCRPYDGEEAPSTIAPRDSTARTISVSREILFNDKAASVLFIHHHRGNNFRRIWPCGVARRPILLEFKACGNRTGQNAANLVGGADYP